MRLTLNLLLILLLTVQCKNVEVNNTQEIEWEETKNSRNYLDYAAFIQKHPNTEKLSKSLSEYLFLRDSVAVYGICQRYNAKISVIGKQKVLFDDEIKNLDSLRFYAFEYLKNGKPNISSSLKTDIQIPESTITDSISTGQFDIVIYKKPFPIKNLKIALTEISKGINDYNEFLAQKWFKKSYSELNSGRQKGIEKLNDKRLVFFDFSDINVKQINQPPPPKSDFEIETEK